MPSSVPARFRDVYVQGVLGLYELPTLARCEKLINQLSQLLHSDGCRDDPKLRAQVESDRDLVLDRWQVLSFEFHAATAMKASR